MRNDNIDGPAFQHAPHCEDLEQGDILVFYGEEIVFDLLSDGIAFCDGFGTEWREDDLNRRIDNGEITVLKSDRVQIWPIKDGEKE